MRNISAQIYINSEYEYGSSMDAPLCNRRFKKRNFISLDQIVLAAGASCGLEDQLLVKLSYNFKGKWKIFSEIVL